jgi:hypothetical protein
MVRLTCEKNAGAQLRGDFRHGPCLCPAALGIGRAVIGSASSIAAIFIQAKFSERRERMRQAASLAMEEYKIQIASSGGKAVLPFSSGPDQNHSFAQ